VSTAGTPLRLAGIDGIRAHAGKDLGVSRWHEVTQADIDRFAEVTGDDQWIHTDPDRAAQTPFGGTIAHGYYTLALAPMFAYELYEITDISFGLNYGVNRVRFPAPLPVGARVRMRALLTEVTDVASGVQLTTELTFETDAGEKPVCVAETLIRVYA
jgi:acyl dehydratase